MAQSASQGVGAADSSAQRSAAHHPSILTTAKQWRSSKAKPAQKSAAGSPTHTGRFSHRGHVVAQQQAHASAAQRSIAHHQSVLTVAR